MPRCRRRAYRGDCRVHIPAREPGAHTRKIDPVGFAEPLEEILPDRSGPPPQYPGRREVDNVQGVVNTEQHIAVVEVSQSYSAAVEFIENRAEAIEERVVEPGIFAFPQWLSFDPASGQGVGSKATEKCRQGVDGSRRLVGRRLATNQPSTEAVPHNSTSRLIRFDRHPLAIQLIKKDIGFGAVASHDPANRFRF